MPIIDIEIVGNPAAPPDPQLARALADAVGAALHAPPGATWVRVRALPVAGYAESGGALPAGDSPVFVTVTRRELPPPSALAAEALAVASAVAAATSRMRERVHVEFAPAAAGRLAFGGVLAD